MSSREQQISPATIACAQFEPRIGDKHYNLEQSLYWIKQAASAGANLVVLPELCNTGYMFATRAEALSLAETTAGVTVSAWCDSCAENNLYLVAGFAERAGDKLYNSAAIISPSGLLGVFRKVHLWGDEHLFFEPGDVGFPVFDAPFGRFGAMICYDQWFAESYRSLALQGADIACVATNWVPIPGQAADQAPMANLIAMTAAHTNSMFVACADRTGIERDQPFLGHSVIVSPTGWPVAGPASETDAELLIATVDVAEARYRRRWNDFNQVIRDRRPEQYITE